LWPIIPSQGPQLRGGRPLQLFPALLRATSFIKSSESNPLLTVICHAVALTHVWRAKFQCITNVKENSMKRTLTLLSMSLVLAIAALAQTSQPTTKAGCANCCKDKCGQSCCKDGCKGGGCCGGK